MLIQLEYEIYECNTLDFVYKDHIVKFWQSGLKRNRNIYNLFNFVSFNVIQYKLDRL